jgi:hypothetical protein
MSKNDRRKQNRNSQTEVKKPIISISTIIDVVLIAQFLGGSHKRARNRVSAVKLRATFSAKLLIASVLVLLRHFCGSVNCFVVNDRLLFKAGRFSFKFIISSRGCGNGGKTRFVFHGFHSPDFCLAVSFPQSWSNQPAAGFRRQWQIG